MSSFETIDDVLATFYEIVSGPAGRFIDWDRERQMYHPGARLMRSGISDDGTPWIKAMTLDEFIEDTVPFFAENDFYEIEIGRHVDRLGNLAQVRSAYEARSHPDAEKTLKRGVNLIQLFNDGSRWWIVGVLWGDERSGLQLPESWIGE